MEQKVGGLVTRDGLTIREAAVALGLRSQSIYNLLRDELLTGEKDEHGGWIISAESVERYRLRRNLRRATSRSAMQRGAIDVTAMPVAAGANA